MPGVVLMETAGRAVFDALWRTYKTRARGGSTAVLCGKGNNGGDGFVVARCLANRGCNVTVYLLGSVGAVGGDAAIHLQAFVGGGGRLVEVGEENRDEVCEELSGAALVVDAILGTGIDDDVRGLAAVAIDWVAALDKPVVSVDIPSGVSSNTGRLCGKAVHADLTVTFAWPKRGHFLHPGAGRRGRLEVADIGIPPAVIARVSPQLVLLEAVDLAGLIERPADGHKGRFGHVVVFGGSPGKEGAAGLAAWAALKAGAGLSTLACPAAVCRSASVRLPLEVMTEPLTAGEAAGEDWSEPLWEASEASRGKADALVVGPGLGTGTGARAFLDRLLSEDGPPVVLDADALNLVAERAVPWSAAGRSVVLTPHPGEAARLLGSSPSAVQADRVGAAVALATRHRCVVILKGAGSLIASPDERVWLVPEGNAGMATAGAGDVLAGVVGALLARGMAPGSAARFGTHVHARAGDRAASSVGEEGLTASDIVSCLGAAMEGLRQTPPAAEKG